MAARAESPAAAGCVSTACPHPSSWPPSPMGAPAAVQPCHPATYLCRLCWCRPYSAMLAGAPALGAAPAAKHWWQGTSD